MTAGAPAPIAASERLSPEALFVIGAIAQYGGASIAVRLFDDVRPITVAWLRVAFGALALLAVSGPDLRRRWDRRSLILVTCFGIATALMNAFIYQAFARLDLGKAVAIEFTGPIVVAAIATRTRRNAAALVLAVGGVILLSQIGFDAVGLAYVLAASAMWAGYIVTGWRVARLERGTAGLAVGLSAGGVVLAPFAVGGLSPVAHSPGLLGACAAVGVLSTAIAYGIDQLVLRRTSARRFALMQALLPVTAAVMGAVVLSQFPAPVEYAGMALILVAVALQSRDA